jgi:hypothetical protein
MAEGRNAMNVTALCKWLAVPVLMSFGLPLCHADTIVSYTDIFHSGILTASIPLDTTALDTQAKSDAPLTDIPSDTSQPVYLPRFNPALGTLDAVTLVADWALDATLYATNYTSGALNLNSGHAYADMYVTGPGNLYVHASPQGGGTNSTQQVQAETPASLAIDPDYTTSSGCLGKHPEGMFLGGACYFISPPKPGQVTFQGTETATGPVTSSLSGTDFSAFAGTGLVELDFNTPGVTFTCMANPNLDCSADGSAGGVVELIYNYTPPKTPEPVSMSLVGSALLALGLCFRRKRA